jgi:hypothetical protein
VNEKHAESARQRGFGVAKKESFMRRFLTGAAIALALASTAFVTAGTANAAGIYISSGTDSHRSGSAISISFGEVAYGYRDGYWDSGHRWHHWRNHRDYQIYRGQHGSHYHNWNHDRDNDNGWQRQ